MGYTLTGIVLSKKDYFSKKRNEQIYQLDLYDGNGIVSVGNVPKDIWDSVQPQVDTISIKCRVSAFSDNGRGRLIVSFLALA